MDELQIKSFLTENQTTKNFFLGVRAYDELPIYQELGFYIVNSGHSSTPGFHWMVIFKENENIEFFDPLARNPSYYSNEIENYLFRNGENYLMSVKALQGNSDLCGNYCIIYSFLRCENYSMSQILSMFSSNLELNDDLVNFNT